MPLIKRKHSTIKAYIHDWLEPDDGKINFFSGVIIALVLVSLTSLALETEALQPDTVDAVLLHPPEVRVDDALGRRVVQP